MSERIATAELSQLATVTAAPVQTRVDRNFGLPSSLYYGTVGLYLVFLGIMTMLFMNGELVLPMAVIVGSLIFGFGINRAWARMKPENDTAALTWGQFANRGIQTLSGPLTAFEASVQVLMLPALIVVWGLAIAVIVATVH